MNQSGSRKTAARKFTPVGIIFAVLGFLLFAYFVKKAGVAEILEGIRRLGAGFLLILLVSAVRPVVRSLAWMRCFETPSRLSLRDAFTAYVIGDAAGSLVPLGIFVSEPVKAALVRERVSLVSSLSSLAIENLFYSLSAALFIFAGAAALLLSFPLSKTLRLASLGALVAIVLLITIGAVFVRKQWRFLSGTLEYLYGCGIARRWLETWRGRVSAMEDRVYGFYERHRSRFLPILLLEACFHLAGVAEVYITLLFISDTPPTLLTAFVLESVNRFITVVFKVVPMRLGVDEAGTGTVTELLKFGKASGVTLAIVRKARILCWMAAGVALLAYRGLSLREVTTGAEDALAGEVEAAKAPPITSKRDGVPRMKRDEARAIIDRHLARYREEPFAQLLRLLETPDDFEVIAPSGQRCVMEVYALWDDEANGHLRVIGALDEGSWKTTFSPWTSDFIMRRNGSFVGE